MPYSPAPDASLVAGEVGVRPERPQVVRSTPTTGVPRLVRVAVLGGASLGLACAAHLVGGGQLPSAGVLVIAGFLIGLAAVTVTARRCRTGTLLGLLAVQQIILHLVFEASSSSTGCGVLVEAAGHHTALVGHAMSSCTAAPAVGADAMSMPGWAMWAGHLSATLVTTLLLARGEAWLWRVADRVIAAATARPSHRRTPQPRHLGVVDISAPVISRGYAPAAPRGPPLLIVVS